MLSNSLINGNIDGLCALFGSMSCFEHRAVAAWSLHSVGVSLTVTTLAVYHSFNWACWV